MVLANVGNVNPTCAQYVFKLCLTAVEARAAAAFEDLEPDLLVLIEVLPDQFCEEQLPTDPDVFRSCSGGPADTQLERLLGDRYDVRCDRRYGWDCVALRKGVGSFTSEVVTPPVLDGCDDGFTVNMVDVTVGDTAIRVLAGHPDSGNDECRTHSLDSLLDLSDGFDSLLIGDFNLDPFREESASVSRWNESVGTDRRFTLHTTDAFSSIPAEESQLDPTGEVTTPVTAPLPPGSPLSPRTLDHVASDFLEGTCGVVRVDGGGGMDHRAQDCRLTQRAQSVEAPAAPEGSVDNAASDSTSTSTLPATGGRWPAAAFLAFSGFAVAVLALRRLAAT